MGESIENEWKVMSWFLEARDEGGLEESMDVVYQVLTVGITNCGMLPLITMAYRNQLYFECIIGFGTFLTSFLYHIGETINYDIWGMNPGKWHRLDNIFSIMSLISLTFYLIIPTENDVIRMKSTGKVVHHSTPGIYATLRSIRKRTEFWRWASLLFAMLCQERSPWNEIYTIVPILIPISIALIYFFYVDEIRPTYSKSWIFAGLILLCCAFVAFGKGLDDENDWLRMAHGLWHLLIALSCYCLFKSKITISEKEKE